MPDRDRLRELLDAVLDEDHRNLAAMSASAYASPHHFTRELSRAAGEPPVAMRRRVMLERAAWRLRGGAEVTPTAWEAGYESVEGFSRAFARAYGHPPSESPSGHWLPAPNGIHFHPPMSLWVQADGHTMSPFTEQQVRHDLDDTRYLLEVAERLSPEALRTMRMPGTTVLTWDGPEETIQRVLEHLVFTKEIWLASIDGAEHPSRDADPDAGRLLERHDVAGPRWLATVRDLDRRGAWDDRLVDALCDPPESFVMSSVLAHVLTYSAHRRQLARHYLRMADQEVDQGDPIMWLRGLRGEDC